ncbi:glycosyltransferase family 4 protein, partial [Candidatus Peregrinibacteria bacterium]|nr:glycosyltransferase family 4 protein [Candidatus Peregrinibacteria bacterium]
MEIDHLIGVNARFLTKPFTGVGQHTKNLLIALGRLDHKNKYILAVHEKVDKNIFKLLPKNMKIKIIPEKKFGSKGFGKTFWEQFSLPKFFIKENADVAFFPYPSNPWANSWHKKGIKTIVTVHDTVPWENKKYTKGVLSKMYHAQSKKAVLKADKIIAVSEVSKNDIAKACGVNKNKITVIYNDAGDAYKKRLSGKFIDGVLKKFKLDDRRFFLYVGGYDERKNVGTLVEEYRKFSRDYAKISKEKIPLVMVGNKLFDTKLYKSFDEKSVGDYGEIIKTGFLDEKILAVLYGSCVAFLSLSEKEGFNIPIVEAANCGAPLILSDILIHKEIAKNNAVYVNAAKKGETAKAMFKILNIGALMRKKSLELAKNYSWAGAA